MSFAGTSLVTGELDLADALDLDDAIRSIAGQLKDLGCEESLDVRRSLAAGELARRQRTTPWRPGRTGGATCTCQLVPLCRSHHRHKTHTNWSITVVEPGHYHWTGPRGLRFRRDHTGTTPLDPPGSLRRD